MNEDPKRAAEQPESTRFSPNQIAAAAIGGAIVLIILIIVVSVAARA